jgi:hypothetical protein
MAATNLSFVDLKTLSASGIVMLSYKVQGSMAAAPPIRYIKAVTGKTAPRKTTSHRKRR